MNALQLVASTQTKTDKTDETFRLVEDLRDIKQQIKALEDIEKKIKADLLGGHFKDNDTFYWNGRKLATCLIITNEIVDKDAIYADHPEMFIHDEKGKLKFTAEYTKESSYKRIDLK